MRKPSRPIDREAVARSLRELDKLFGKSPDKNENAHGKVGAGETLLTGKLKRGVVR